jgi:indolepyruvate ferredoxin oxidoreductase
MRIAAPYPIDRQRVESFASGLERLLVVEEKGDFLESQVKSILYALENRPTVLGKRDERGKPLVPAQGELVVEKLQGRLWRFLDPVIEVERPKTVSLGLSLLPVQRTPYFCSGCPHNKSTVVPEGSIAAAGQHS